MKRGEGRGVGGGTPRRDPGVKDEGERPPCTAWEPWTVQFIARPVRVRCWARLREAHARVWHGRVGWRRPSAASDGSWPAGRPASHPPQRGEAVSGESGQIPRRLACRHGGRLELKTCPPCPRPPPKGPSGGGEPPCRHPSPAQTPFHDWPTLEQSPVFGPRPHLGNGLLQLRGLRAPLLDDLPANGRHSAVRAGCHAQPAGGDAPGRTLREGVAPGRCTIVHSSTGCCRAPHMLLGCAPAH